MQERLDEEYEAKREIERQLSKAFAGTGRCGQIKREEIGPVEPVSFHGEDLYIVCDKSIFREIQVHCCYPQSTVPRILYLIPTALC